MIHEVVISNLLLLPWLLLGPIQAVVVAGRVLNDKLPVLSCNSWLGCSVHLLLQFSQPALKLLNMRGLNCADNAFGLTCILMTSMLSPSGLIGGRNLDLLVKAVMVGLEVAGHLLVVL